MDKEDIQDDGKLSIDQRVVQELYQRSAEFALKNKTLMLLGELDHIALEAIDIGTMARSITDAISSNLGYDFVSVAVHDEKQHVFRWLGFASPCDWLKKHCEELHTNGSVISTIMTDSGDKRFSLPQRIEDTLRKAAEEAATTPVSNSFFMPLKHGDQLLGVLVLSSRRALGDMSRYEMESVKGVSELVTLAFYKAKIYEQLHDLNEHLEDKVREQTKEIRRAYEVEKEARHELEALDKAKTDFILTTQHHLRTPLTVVKGMINMALCQRQALPEHVAEYLEKAEANAERLGALVNEFLEISQMEVGKSVLHCENTTFYSIMPDVISDVHDDIEKKHISLREFFTSEAREEEFPLDKKKIHDALLNIFDNAVKYTPENGTISVSAMLTIHPIEKTRIYRLSISDSGIGMTNEELKHVFTRSFERGEKAKELNATGRGLGLMLTKQIIESHGGSVRAESEGRDKGSTFTIELPVVSAK